MIETAVQRQQTGRQASSNKLRNAGSGGEESSIRIRTFLHIGTVVTMGGGRVGDIDKVIISGESQS